MRPLEGKEIVDALSGEFLERGSSLPVRGVSTDSRTLREGDLFFALRGERYDGHDFVGEALDRGAWGAVVERGWKGPIPDGANIIGVRDTMRALGDLASYYRSLFDIPLVAITGSCGKTTTKEMAGAILSISSNPLVSKGNYNNLIGLPLTLFDLEDTHSVAVVELGVNMGREEMERLVEISMPTIGTITNIGISHLEGMGGIEGVREAKLELFRRIEGRGCMVVNLDDPMVVEGTSCLKGRRVTYGIHGGDVSLVSSREDGEGISYEVLAFGNRLRGRIRAFGFHNVHNLLCAVAIAKALGVDDEAIVEGLSTFRPVKGRMEFIDLGSVRVIDDSYNANPTSMAASLKALSDLDARRRIAVLGDMLELGERAPSFHFDLGRLAGSLSIDLLYLAGRYREDVRAGAISAGMDEDRVRSFEDKEGLWRDLRVEICPGDLILVKASRAVGMEEIVERIKGRFSESRGLMGETIYRWRL